MKKVHLLCTLFLAFLIIGTNLFAQAPEGIHYQAVARDNQGEPIVNTLIGVKIEVLKGGASGTVTYAETQAAFANTFGIIGFDIGMGLPISGSFSNIDWGADQYWVRISIDIDGGTNYAEIGSSMLMSVPYAIYAKYAENGGGGGGDTQCLSVSATGDTLYISGCNWVIVPGISAANGGGGGDIVYDFDGNGYNTVVIGQQTWIKECLRSEHDANGNTIQEAWDYDDNPANSLIYGKLYSWESAMNGSGPSSGNPSGVQGICPSGWHIPSQAEWDQLVDFLGGSGSAWKMKEVGNTYWDNNPNSTNESGYSARGAGHRKTSGEYSSFKQTNKTWSTTEYTVDKAYYKTIYDNMGGVVTHSDSKEAGFSVRCIKN